MESSTTGRRLEKSTSGLRMVPVSDSFACPFALPEPIWISDKESVSCSSCKRNFDFFNRKHHCRRCGQCFCDRCCHHTLPLKRLYFVDPVRQCYDCAVISKTESEFYDKSISTLITGCAFAVSESATAEDFGKCKCCLSTDHRQLLRKDLRPGTPCIKVPTLILSKIVNAKITMREQQDTNGTVSKIPTGFTLTYKDAENNAIMHEETFQSVDEKAAVHWLAAFQKALKFVFEANETMKE